MHHEALVMNIRLIHDVAWTTATKVVMALDAFGLEEETRVAAFQAIRPIIEEGVRRFDERRRRELARLVRREEPQSINPQSGDTPDGRTADVDREGSSPKASGLEESRL